jgi:hypothetical protein
MDMKTLKILIAFVLLFLIGCNQQSEKKVTGGVWTLEKANAWQEKTGWLSGCNFLPSTAVNSLEFWQKETFDPITIDRELGFAEDLGFNIMRVWLSSLTWKNDPEGFKERINQYLTISNKHHIGTMFVFFCDCWNPDSKPGPQPAPLTGIHNSQWVQDPSCDLRTDTTSLYPWLEKYVKDIISSYKDDSRIIVWDLFNEPGQKGHDDFSLLLVKNVFKWARTIIPSQPLTSGLNKFNSGARTLNLFLVKNSDIITYHNYNDPGQHMAVLSLLQLYGRPMICTEWMARHFNSKFQNILPMLKRENVGAINWGLVSGKTNTIYKWGEPVPDGSEPKMWFHDILRKDGTPFDQVEIDSIKAINRRR